MGDDDVECAEGGIDHDDGIDNHTGHEHSLGSVSRPVSRALHKICCQRRTLGDGCPLTR